MRTFALAAIAFAVSVSASTLAAQPGRGDMPRDRAINSARGGGSPADAILRQRTALALTDAQVQTLEALAQSQRASLAPTPSEQMRLRADLMQAMEGEGNPQAARAALDKLSAVQNARIVAEMEARIQARAVLTPDQRSRAEASRGAVQRTRGMVERSRGQAARSRGVDARARGMDARARGVEMRGARVSPRGPRPER